MVLVLWKKMWFLLYFLCVNGCSVLIFCVVVCYIIEVFIFGVFFLEVFYVLY